MRSRSTSQRSHGPGVGSAQQGTEVAATGSRFGGGELVTQKAVIRRPLNVTEDANGGVLQRDGMAQPGQSEGDARVDGVGIVHQEVLGADLLNRHHLHGSVGHASHAA